MIRTDFLQETHWHVRGGFLAVHRIDQRRWLASVYDDAGKRGDGCRIGQCHVHHSRTKAINAGIRALLRARNARRS